MYRYPYICVRTILLNTILLRVAEMPLPVIKKARTKTITIYRNTNFKSFNCT